ncbi:MAG TPA: IS4 family transposase, partial [Pirellulales bacterium]|nr:IS4 family transposase [Pirellulales bacterium]
PIGVKLRLARRGSVRFLAQMHNRASTRPADQFAELLGRLPSGLDLDALARQTCAIQRRRALCDGGTLLRLALARGPGGLSLKQTAAWAELIGLAHMSDPAIKYRLDKAVPFLKSIMDALLTAHADARTLHWPGRILRAVDGTHVNQPGSTGTDWRIHAAFDLGRGGFSHLELTDKHGAESVERGAPVPGEVRICDRNFASAPALHRFRTQSGSQADFVVRARWKSFRLTRSDGASFNLIEHLKTLPVDDHPQEVLVQAKLGGGDHLPLRLIILRRPAEIAEQIRKRLKRQAPRKQKTVHPNSLVAAEFLILATSLAAEGYKAEEILAAYRLRWQIELAFKRLKSLLHIDRLPARTPQASRSWLYAHLILALLVDDISQGLLDSSPSGPARRGVSALALDPAGHRLPLLGQARTRAALAPPPHPGRTQRPSPPRQLTAKAKAPSLLSPAALI